MHKPVIAVLFGGCSSEYQVSLQSAHAVLTGLDPARWAVVPIGITREGEWFHYHGPYEALLTDTWHQDPLGLTPVAVSQSRSIRGLVEFTQEGPKVTKLDCALPILHGKNGEDGTVQGLFQLAGIPVAGCGILSSALCMDKDRAHKLAAMAGVSVPRSLVLAPGYDVETLRTFARKTGFPLFVKPVKAGSSHGITRVLNPEELTPAITLAFQYDDRVILEEAIPGFEVGCAVMGWNVLRTGEPDEIELTQGFFDFHEKYNLETSAIHVPARVDPETLHRIKETAKTIYRVLDCQGFARVDLFVTPDKGLVFNEVNTIPGFTPHSRFPGMMQAAGLDFPSLLNAILEGALEP